MHISKKKKIAENKSTENSAVKTNPDLFQKCSSQSEHAAPFQNRKHGTSANRGGEKTAKQRHPETRQPIRTSENAAATPKNLQNTAPEIQKCYSN